MPYPLEAYLENFEFQYIVVRHDGSSPSGKTHMYVVENKRSGDLLGTIRWHAPWRQYVYFAAPLTLYSSGCLADIKSVIDALMAGRKS